MISLGKEPPPPQFQSSLHAAGLAAGHVFLKLGPHDAWFVFMMHHASWFAHRVYEKMCLIWVDVSFIHSSHLVRQLDGKLTHQSKLYVSDSTNLFDTFPHDAPQIRTTHHVDPAYQGYSKPGSVHRIGTTSLRILISTLWHIRSAAMF